MSRGVILSVVLVQDDRKVLIDVEETQTFLFIILTFFVSILTRSMSSSCNLRRHNSWPWTTALEQTYKHEVKGYGYSAKQNLPGFLRRNEEFSACSSTDSDMPLALCGWCGETETNCNGVNLFYCRTWRNLSAELNLELPLHLRAHFWSDGFTTIRRCVRL